MPYPRHIPPHEVVRHFGLIKDNVLFIITLSKVNRTLLFLDTSSFYIRNNMNEPIGLPCFWHATDNSPVAIFDRLFRKNNHPARVILQLE